MGDEVDGVIVGRGVVVVMGGLCGLLVVNYSPAM